MAKTSKRGGARQGAGRPKGFDKERARQKLREMVWAEMDAMTQAQIDNAKGIKYLVVRERKGGKFVRVTEAMANVKLGQANGEEIVEVWEKDPSVHAYSDLMDRTIGRPKEVLEAEVTLRGDLVDRLKAGRDRLAKAKHGNGTRHG
jgi:hypothetical protein